MFINMSVVMQMRGFNASCSILWMVDGSRLLVSIHS